VCAEKREKERPRKTEGQEGVGERKGGKKEKGGRKEKLPRYTL